MREFDPSVSSQPLAQLKIESVVCANTPLFGAFRAFPVSLQSPKNGNSGENLPKVSGQVPGYSRFAETSRGDKFRTALVRRCRSWSLLPPAPQNRRIAPSFPFWRDRARARAPLQWLTRFNRQELAQATNTCRSRRRRVRRRAGLAARPALATSGSITEAQLPRR